MKLQSLSEARYHVDPNEQLLKLYFDKEDEDDEHAWFSPKDDVVIMVDNPFGGDLEKVMVSHVITYDAGAGKEYAVFVHGGDGDIGDGKSLDWLEVYKRVQ
jgi:hypothetical protein